MKDIKSLDLSHDEIGDLGIFEIIKELDATSLNLEDLNLSGNGIGKNFTYFGRYLESLIHYLTHTSRLATLRLSHNNLRGSAGGGVDKLLISLMDVTALKNLDLSHNLLGRNYGP